MRRFSSPLTLPQDLRYLLQGAGTHHIVQVREAPLPASQATCPLDYKQRTGLEIAIIHSPCAYEAKALSLQYRVHSGSLVDCLPATLLPLSPMTGEKYSLREFNRLTYSDYPTASATSRP